MQCSFEPDISNHDPRTGIKVAQSMFHCKSGYMSLVTQQVINLGI